MSRPDDPEPPRLQDTTERDALPLPVAGGEPAPGDEPPPPEVVAAEAGPEEAGADKSPAVDEPSPEPDPPAPDPAPADKAASVDAPGSPNGSASGESPFPPPYGPDISQGPRPEVLVGAAFAGGLLLALIFRRLGR